MFLFRSPYRKVVSMTLVAHSYGRKGGKYAFVLECGHRVTEKQSSGIPAYKRCPECRSALMRNAYDQCR
jgi:hypothetical protein